MTDRTSLAHRCTDAIACPTCGAVPGEYCNTDRPIHLERWDAWRANAFKEQPK